MRTIKQIIKIYNIKGYKIHCLFNNGQSRVIDFQQLFEQWNVEEGDLEYPLTQSVQAFQKVELVEGTLTWNNIKIHSTDEDGKAVAYPFDLDPIVLYEASIADTSRTLEVGLMIKQARKELGLTQEQLALKSGTSKHYISRIENNKSGIELATLVKIIEGGLGKRLEIQII